MSAGGGPELSAPAARQATTPRERTPRRSFHHRGSARTRAETSPGQNTATSSSPRSSAISWSVASAKNWTVRVSGAIAAPVEAPSRGATRLSQRRPPGSSESGAYQAGPSRGVTAGVAHANNRFVRAPPGSPTRSETGRRAGGGPPQRFHPANPPRPPRGAGGSPAPPAPR